MPDTEAGKETETARQGSHPEENREMRPRYG